MLRLCIEAGCTRGATRRGRCADHARTHERDRNRTITRKGDGQYNRKLWRMRRLQQLYREPFCADPLGRHNPEYPVIAEIVHHVDGIENDPHHQRLQSLCWSCHSALHRVGSVSGDDQAAKERRDARWRVPVEIAE
jgi:hypothetical protein